MNRLQIFNSAIRNSVALNRGKLNRSERISRGKKRIEWTKCGEQTRFDRPFRIEILFFVLILNLNLNLNLNRVESSNGWRGNKDFSYFHIEILGIFEKEPFPQNLEFEEASFLNFCNTDR